MERTLQSRTPIDVADVQHMAALVTGGLLFITGHRKKGFAGMVLKAAGTALLYRGQHDYRRLYDAAGLRMKESASGLSKSSVRVESEIVVARPREELYRIWRNLENLPVFMDHLVSVVEINDCTSRWVARAPAGMVVSWDARIINDIENELIAWESLMGSGVGNAGSVHFTDEGDSATRIRVVLRYDPPAHLFGGFIAKVFSSDPQRGMERDLQRFKRIMEIGSAVAQSRSEQSL